MIVPGSRYENAEHIFTLVHVYNDRGYPLLEGDPGRTPLQVTTVSRDTLYLNTVVPAPPPFEYFAKDGEIMPQQAFRFLEDANRWWEIAAANPQIWYPLDMKMGSYMRVPL